MTLPADSRIDALIDLLSQLASGDLAARGVRSSLDDETDAVIEGINMLAEELEASREQFEERVRIRTLELQRANRDIRTLAEVGSLLHACDTLEEAHEVISQGLSSLFAGCGSGVYVFRSSRNLVELKATAGGLLAPAVLAPSECWALRRGSVHVARRDRPSLTCGHVGGQQGGSICVPMSAHGEILGLLHVLVPHAAMIENGTLEGGTIGQIGSDHDGGPLDAFGLKRQLAMAAGEQIALALANLELRQKLQLQALRDPLTGLHNRRFVDEWIEREVIRCDDSGYSLGVIMVDVDHFKKVNDQHGHDAGDALLQGIAAALKAALRSNDLCCRYGGEEFLVLLSDIDLDSLSTRAEALRENVARVRVEHHQNVLPPVTLSAGIALYPTHGSTASDVVQAADGALYLAKRSGRDQTCSAN